MVQLLFLLPGVFSSYNRQLQDAFKVLARKNVPATIDALHLKHLTLVNQVVGLEFRVGMSIN